MRVISGSARGHHLRAASQTRPTADLIKGAIFSMLEALAYKRGFEPDEDGNLAAALAWPRVLDLFAGSGGLGIEALSRGARSVTFIESDRRAETLIAENLAHCGVDNGYAIIRDTVARAIDQLDAAAFGPYELFDIVWFDPPYDEQPDAVIAASDKLIAPGGLLVLEHARRRPAPETAGRLVRVRQVTSGDSMLSFFELKH
jgi:16S rRNA (guanine966-N2)-methyltransferase